jgi:NADPH:quinone reductase-like Zn-dependent oxidoreductase
VTPEAAHVDTMNAVRAHRRGGPEQLVFEVTPRPEPAPGEVLVAVHAASVTPDELTWDPTWTDSLGPGGRDRTPIIPSHEMSGVVAELGAGVTTAGVGDEVYGLIPFDRDGAAAEYVAVPADILAAKPGTVDHDTAATVPLAALTAYQALMDHASLRPGQHLLIHGAGGGVGSFAVQLAAGLGAEVTGTAGGQDKARVTKLGAHQVVDYATERFEDHVDQVDVVLDMVGGEVQDRSWSVLRPGGVLVSVFAPPDAGEAAAHGASGVFFIVEPSRAQLETITGLIDTGRLTAAVDRVVPLSETRAAYEALQNEHRRGKVVIHVAG